jgi:hypothetical protein
MNCVNTCTLRLKMLFKRSNVMTFSGKNDYCKGSTSLSVQEFEASVGQPLKQGKSDNPEYYTHMT